MNKLWMCLAVLQFLLYSPFFAVPSVAKLATGNRPDSAPLLPAPELPQCTDNFVLTSEVQMERASGESENVKRLNITAHLQLATIALGETFCMLIMANKSMDGGGQDEEGEEEELLSEYGIRQQSNRFSMLHTIEYVRLELHHAITSAYKFAIPAITPRCKCDCAGGETICSIGEHQYGNCSAGAICYRTHRGGQANTGCLTSGNAEICCQVEINPYRGWTFQAIRLKQPSTVLVLRYRIFERAQASSTQWANSVDETMAIPLNKGTTKFELNAGRRAGEEPGRGQEWSQHRIEISAAGGRPHRQMDSGMYFFQIYGDPSLGQSPPSSSVELREGVALNGPGESSLEKLGWLRWDRALGWTVRKGMEKITQAQHVRVEDCKAQRYRATFNAEQFVLMRGGRGEEAEELANFDLGTPVREEAWVGSLKVGDREVVVEHAEGTALALTVRTESRPRIVRHNSQFANFTGTIVLDKESNRYLNLTFQNARGTLIGQIFSSADSLSVMESIFSIDIGKYTVQNFQRVVATSVQSPKLVCFYPIGDLEGRLCQQLAFIGEPLQQEKHFADQWQQGQAECRGCNERGVDSFLASLDPRQWLDGLNTPVELFTCLLEVVLCIVLLMASVLLLTKCVIPLCRFVASVKK